MSYYWNGFLCALEKHATFPYVASNPVLQRRLAAAWKRYYENSDDPAHGTEHIKAVVEAARALARDRKLDLDAVLTAAVLHDIGRGKESKKPSFDHAAVGARVARDIIRGMFPNKTEEQIIEAIREHRASGGHPRGLLARLISDADKVSDIMNEPLMLKRFVDYRRAHGISDPKALVEDAFAYFPDWLEKMKRSVRSEEAKRLLQQRMPYLQQLLDRATFEQRIKQVM